MKNKLLLTALICLGQFIATSKTYIDNVTESKIEAKPSIVTVFLTGAQLGHKTEVKLVKGKNQLKFIGLSSKMDQGSIVVDIENKNMVILSVFFNNNFLAEIEKNPQVKAVLFGHIHQVFEAHVNGTFYASAPSTSFQVLPNTKTFTIEELTPGYRTIELYENKINSKVVWVE